MADAAAAASARRAAAPSDAAEAADAAADDDDDDDADDAADDDGTVKLKVSNSVKKTPACVCGRSRHLLLDSHASNAPEASNTATLNFPFVVDRQYTKLPRSSGTVMR